MGSVEIEQKSYEMQSRDGISVAHFLTVADMNDRPASTKESSAGAF